MNILVIDSNKKTEEQISSSLKPAEHLVIHAADTRSAIAAIQSSDPFIPSIVFIDSDSHDDLKAQILDLKRVLPDYAYMVHVSNNAALQDSLKTGANGVLLKPFHEEHLKTKLNDAARLKSLIERLGDDSEDFPSAGGIIAKSAFYQLFYAGIDRADRYGERSYVIFVGLSNYQDILDMDGAYAADYAVAKLSQHLNKIRRQSDIIGQTARYEYALLLQRPSHDEEPINAAKRYAEELSKLDDIYENASEHIKMHVRLVDLPVGQEISLHNVVRAG